MVDDIATVVLRVQAGQAPAFIELVQRLNAELRVWIATYALDLLMIDDVALAVWCAVRRAPASCPAAPMPWILAFAERELAQRLGVTEEDPLRRLLMEAAANELRAAGQPATTAAQHVQRRLAMMPPMARRLLTRHYGERLPLADLAVAQGVTNEDVADSLVMARSTLDWHPDAMSGPIAHGAFSGVIEDFLNGALDGEPRERFGAHLAADAERTATFVRQTRLDLMLRIMLAPPVEGEGKVMAQAAWATVASGDGLMIAQPPELRPRPAAPTGHGSDRTTRRPNDGPTRRITVSEPTTRRINASEPSTRRHTHQRLDADGVALTKRKSGLVVMVLSLVGLALACGVAVLALSGRSDAPHQRPLLTHADPVPTVPAPPPTVAPTPAPVASPFDGPGPAATGAVTFVRGINFGGDPVVIDHHRWLAQDQAVAGGLALTAEAVATTIPPLSGAGFDFDGKAMLESGLSANDAPLRMRQALPPGTYEVMLWVAGPDAGNPLAITIGDQPVNVAAAPSATWRKLGPYRVALAGAQLELAVTGLGRAHLSGMTLSTVGKPSAPLPPIALLTSPTDHFTQDSTRPLELVADVIPAGAAITAVAFMDGDKVLATVTAPPYRLAIPKLPAGTFAFTVVATAADGGRGTSPAATGTIVDVVVGAGSILREKWLEVAGEQLRAVQGNAKLMGPPTETSMLTAFQVPTNDSFDYFDRVRGFITPPLGGSYTFWISSDDNAELYLSTDEDPAHLMPLLCWCGCVRENDWDATPEMRSRPVALEVGRRYYIEARHKQGGGGSHLAVGWQMPDGFRERPIPGIRLSPWLAGSTPPVAVALPVPAPTPTPAPVAAPTPPPASGEKPPRFALGIDFGGEGMVFEGNHWLSQHQTEELEVPMVTIADTFLSELPLADAQVGFGGLRRDADLDGRPLTIGKATFKRGLFTHAPATVLVPLDGHSTLFIVDVGVETYVGGGTVNFEVYLDDAKVADTGVVRAGEEAKHLEVPLGKGKMLKLVAGDGGDGSNNDHAIWGDARLVTPRPSPYGPAAGLKGAKHSVQNVATKPPSDGPLKAMLNTSVQGRSDTLAFALKVPNGVYDAWFWACETATSGSHVFDLEVQGVALKGLGGLPNGGWSKYGPLRVTVANGVLTLVGKATKGVPTLSGMALFAIDP